MKFKYDGRIKVNQIFQAPDKDGNPGTEFDEFFDSLTRPIYVYRMTRAMLNHPNPSMRKSAETRAKRARMEIEELVKNYVSRDTD